MFLPFENLPAESRVWIYTGSRAFTEKETETITALLHAFCEQWVAHGHPLQSSFQILENQFVVLAVNEDFHNPSGCSIDSSVGVLRKIQETTGIDLLDRKRVPFLVNQKIELITLAHLKIQFQQGILQSSILTFNTLATTKHQLQNWKLPAESSWLAKYLPKPALTQ
ncbi:MAG TPA: hypothetical protein DHV26_13345 [Cytophagales bacterium]|nr:hypothetical protein [Cytophagales bacterium]HRG09803.1 hypothetical protein [Cyclobacteriaceae bacterium]